MVGAVALHRRSFLLFLFAGAAASAAKKSQAKGPEVLLVDHSAKVEDGKVVLDGHVRNVAGKPIRRLNVIYELLDSDKNVLTRQTGAIDQEELAPDQEVAFDSQIQYVARSVYYRLAFEDGSEKELRCEKTGPFPIES